MGTVLRLAARGREAHQGKDHPEEECGPHQITGVLSAMRPLGPVRQRHRCRHQVLGLPVDAAGERRACLFCLAEPSVEIADGDVQVGIGGMDLQGGVVAARDVTGS